MYIKKGHSCAPFYVFSSDNFQKPPIMGSKLGNNRLLFPQAIYGRNLGMLFGELKEVTFEFRCVFG